MRHAGDGGGWQPVERWEQGGEAVEDEGGGRLVAWQPLLILGAPLHLAVLAVT